MKSNRIILLLIGGLFYLLTRDEWIDVNYEDEYQSIYRELLCDGYSRQAAHTLTCKILDRKSESYKRYHSTHQSQIKGVAGKYNENTLSIGTDYT